MAEKMNVCSVQKEKGYLYYVGKDGNVWASQMARGSNKGGNAKKLLMLVSKESLDGYTL